MRLRLRFWIRWVEASVFGKRVEACRLTWQSNGAVGFGNSKRQTFIITPFVADLPSGETLQQWPLAPASPLPPRLPPLRSPVSHLRPKTLKENKRIQRNNIWGHRRWGRHSGKSGGFWGNILLFFYYGGEWETSEKHTSQLFSSKNGSRAIKADFQSFTAYHSLLDFLHLSITPPPTHTHTFFLSLHPLSFLLTLGNDRNLLPVGTANNKHPSTLPSWTLGQETPHIRTCVDCHDNKHHLSLYQCQEEPVLRGETRTHRRKVDLGQGLKTPFPVQTEVASSQAHSVPFFHVSSFYPSFLWMSRVIFFSF